MIKCYLFFISIIFSSIYALDVLAAGGENTTVTPAVSTGSTTSVNNLGTASDLNNTNPINQGILPYSGFSSSFSGFSSFGNQCGLSISGGYGNNGNPLNTNAWQIVSTFNTNPCTNQNDLENSRQENENKREVIRASAQIITTCINARSQAAQKNVNPDSVCRLQDFKAP